MKRFIYITGIILSTCCYVEADLVAHYDFSDGDLLDNEVGPDLSLVNAGKLSVTLGDGVAEFAPSNSNKFRGPQNYLLMDTDQNFKQFTVSFWFKTDVVDQEHVYGGIFSSRNEADPTSFQFFSAGKAIENNYNIGSGAILIRANSEKNQVNSHAFKLHQANTWYHVGLVYDGSDLSTTISSSDGSFGDLVYRNVLIHDLELDDFLFGTNRGLTQGYGFELANVKIFDSVEALEPLYNETRDPAKYVSIPEPTTFGFSLSVLSFSIVLVRRRLR